MLSKGVSFFEALLKFDTGKVMLAIQEEIDAFQTKIDAAKTKMSEKIQM